MELTEAENAVLVWLCGWDEWTIEAIMNVFRELKNHHGGNGQVNHVYIQIDVLRVIQSYIQAQLSQQKGFPALLH